MLDDLDTVGSPGWWLDRLIKRLQARQERLALLDAYYAGNHRLPEGDQRCREAFRMFQRKARTNFCQLVADSVRERLVVVGFRTGSNSDTDLEVDDDAVAADKQAWRIWQANHLDADSNLLHSAALTFSEAYAIVGPPQRRGGTPLITMEDPRQVITEPDPLDRRRVRAALKSWVDDIDGRRHAVVYLPDAQHYFHTAERPRIESENPVVGSFDWFPKANGWEIERDPTVNTLGEVPVVSFTPNPTLASSGLGEFEGIIDVQDRINDTVLNRLVITKLQAFRQRWAKGLVVDDDEAPFVPGVDLLWVTDDPDVEFGEFPQVDLTPLLKAVEEDVHAIVMLTGLPPHYVAGDLVNASADALAAAEARLVSKVRDRQQYLGESWEQVLRLAFAHLGEPDRIGPDAEVIWADPERKSDAQVADAATKKSTVGVPWRQLMVDLGYSPTEIERMESERAGDALLAESLAAPAVSPLAPSAPPTVEVPADARVV